ncbi:MAG: hypothetical protein J6V44_13935 [Methanobrevibacter sp.]|nr:hypothetical protein [Methanobrevibacter sp.]
MTSYYVDAGKFSPMAIPVPDLETGYALCAEIYNSGMKNVRLIKMGDTYEDREEIDLKEFLNKLDNQGNRLEKIKEDF